MSILWITKRKGRGIREKQKIEKKGDRKSLVQIWSWGRQKEGERRVTVKKGLSAREGGMGGQKWSTKGKNQRPAQDRGKKTGRTSPRKGRSEMS